MASAWAPYAPGGAIDDNTKTAFARDQFVVIHPNQYIPETGYLACGETYLVTDTGAEKLAADGNQTVYERGVTMEMMQGALKNGRNVWRASTCPSRSSMVASRRSEKP